MYVTQQKLLVKLWLGVTQSVINVLMGLKKL